MRGVETIYLAFLIAVAAIAAIGFVIVWNYISSRGATKQSFAGWASGYMPEFYGGQMVLPDGISGAPGSAPTIIGYCMAYKAPDGSVVYSCPGIMPGIANSTMGAISTSR